MPQGSPLLLHIMACTLNRRATAHLFLWRLDCFKRGTNGKRGASKDTDNNNYNVVMCPTHVILYVIDMMDVPACTHLHNDPAHTHKM